jgi:hypothetical protein
MLKRGRARNMYRIYDREEYACKLDKLWRKSQQVMLKKRLRTAYQSKPARCCRLASLTGGMQELDVSYPDQGTIEFMYKHGGARSLVGIELYYRPPQDRRTRMVNLVKLNKDGNS